MQNMTVHDLAEEVGSHGFARIAGPFRTTHEAKEFSGALVDACRCRYGLPPLSIIGEFVVPPRDAGETRDFQTLHFDFGVPLDPRIEQEVARYTALHVSARAAEVRAATRLVPLAALLAQRSWPPPGELIDRLTSYGRTHGAWQDDRGYVEGSLARLIDGATACPTPLLPSVKIEPGFLCGLEFNSLPDERAFLERHGLHLNDVEISVGLRPGELLVFDNLAVAHGRRGSRQPGELRQWMFGHNLQPAEQVKLRNRVLAAFYERRCAEAATSMASVP
jgi:Taurine catabolism dioxygenase TauD, TfdA family